MACSMVWHGWAVAIPRVPSSLAAVSRLLHAMKAGLPDPDDQDAIDRLDAVLSAAGATTLSSADSPEAWVALTFDRDGRLQAVELDPDRLLEAPALIQQAVILHEVEHVKRAGQTRRVVNGLLARQAAQGGRFTPDTVPILHALIRALVDEEAVAHARGLRHVRDAVEVAGGLRAYVAQRPDAEQDAVTQFYRSQVQPLLQAGGALDERRLREMIFSDMFPRQYPHYYAAALQWETFQDYLGSRRTRAPRLARLHP